MRKFSHLAILLLAIGFAAPVFSAASRYEIRADGLACPYCAYGIEKKFMQIDGVSHVDVNLKKGLVLVTGKEDLVLQEPQLKTSFNDSGFTYRKMKKLEHGKPNS